MPQKDKAAYNDYMREYMRRRYQRRRSRAIAQLGGRCVRCGCSDPDKLDFDHVNAATRSFRIGERLAGISEARLQAEMKKCQLLCGECHQQKTTDAGERCNKGSQNKASKLTEEIVLEARQLWRGGAAGISIKALAAEYGVSPTTMSMALRRKTWKHI